MALDTVQDYVDRARVLLQDQSVGNYRYPDIDLVAALSIAVLEARRLRPDVLQVYLNTTLPSFSAATMTAAVPIDPMYRMAFVYYVCGHAQLRDDENVQDSRARAFMAQFNSSLMGLG